MRIRVAHASLQFGDTNKQHTADITKIFERANARKYAWIMGTEAGPGANNTSDELVRIGEDHGYKMWVPSAMVKHDAKEGSTTDCWIAVREDLVVSGWKTGFDVAIPGSAELYKEAGVTAKFPRWGTKGLVHVQFKSRPELGVINLGCAHYLTGARDPEHATINKVNHWEWNQKLAGVIAKWAKTVGKGSALAFYSGDQNMADQRNDTPEGDSFMGGPLTSLADELKDWQNTGHGPIDVIASYNGDKRVVGQSFTVLDDREFPLNVDHFFLEGVFRVEPLPLKK